MGIGVINHLGIGLDGHGSGSSYFIPTILEGLVQKGSVYFGTGTSWQAFYSNPTGSLIFKSQPVQDTKVPIKDVQEYICLAFNLSIGELASACHKSRKSLYDWRDGAVPRPNAAERVFKLYRAANDWLDTSNPISKVRLREPMLADRSLLDLLTADDIDLEAIAFLRRRLDMESSNGIDLDDPYA